MPTKKWTVAKSSCFSLSLNNEVYYSKIYHFILFQVLPLILVALTFSCHALTW